MNLLKLKSQTLIQGLKPILAFELKVSKTIKQNKSVEIVVIKEPNVAIEFHSE